VVYDAGAVSRRVWFLQTILSKPSRRQVTGEQRVRRTGHFVTPRQFLRSSSGQYGDAALSQRQVQILFSNSVMVSTSACWLSAMFLASVIASGFLPEVISAWAILIAPW
jgi:hypothetical protein